jgi:thiol-disulfide isomerase/thioredoxin
LLKKDSFFMTFLKPLAWGAIILILYLAGVFQQLASFTQAAAIHSGLLNAHTTANSKTPFDYNFVLKDLTGKKIEFKEFQGKVVFLNLWATWCGPCRSEMAAIQKLYEGMDKEKVSFVMLSLDSDAHVEKVKAYVASRSFTFPVYMPSGYLADQLQVPSIPTTFIITKDGVIDLKEVGMKNYNTPKFKKYLEQLASR